MSGTATRRWRTILPRPGQDHLEIADADGQTIAIVHGASRGAHAQLIAAAPDLLAALRDLVEIAPLSDLASMSGPVRAARARAIGAFYDAEGICAEIDFPTTEGA